MRCSRITVPFVLIAGVIAFHTSVAFAQQPVDAQLMDRITQSKNALQKVQRNISAESRDYANKLNDLETKVKNAREKVAVQQRLADEQLLSIEKLNDRVEKWETQSNYQSHILRHYRDSIGFKSPGDQSDLDLLPVLARLDSAVNPSWKSTRVVTDGGKIVDAPVLKLGPVEVSILKDSQVAGLLVREIGLEPYVQSVFDDAAQKALFALHDKGTGLYPFDPTLGNALQLRNYGDGLAEHLRKGGLWAIPIVFFGFLSLFIAVLKAVQLLRLPKINDGLAEQLRDQDSVSIDPALNDVGPAQRKLVQIAAVNPVSQQRDDLLVAQLMEYKHTLEKYMGVVATSAAVAPLLGLLGTVSGMIDTFKMMTIFGSGDASTVSGGISEALITTELGLIVAIPSLIISALLTRQIKHYTHRLEQFAIRLSKISFAEKAPDVC